MAEYVTIEKCSSCQNKDVGVIKLKKIKEKVIEEYKKLLKSMYSGHILDYQLLLNEINYIEIIDDLPKQDLYSQYFMNYEYNNGYI